MKTDYYLQLYSVGFGGEGGRWGKCFRQLKKGNGVVTYPCVTMHSGPDDRKISRPRLFFDLIWHFSVCENSFIIELILAVTSPAYSREHTVSFFLTHKKTRSIDMTSFDLTWHDMTKTSKTSKTSKGQDKTSQDKTGQD